MPGHRCRASEPSSAQRHCTETLPLHAALKADIQSHSSAGSPPEWWRISWAQTSTEAESNQFSICGLLCQKDDRQESMLAFMQASTLQDIQCVLRWGMRGMTHVLRAPPQPAGRSAGRIRRCTSGELGRCCLHRSPPAGSWTQTRPATSTRPLFSMGSTLASYAGPTPLNRREKVDTKQAGCPPVTAS